MIMHSADIDHPEIASTVAPAIQPPRAEIVTVQGYEDPARPWKHVAAVAAAMVMAASGSAR